MNDLNVRIVTLPPLTVVSVYGFGPSPEFEAWEKLETWARPLGLRDDPARHRIFGFNNPNPSPGSPNYGYELWIEIDPGMETAGDVKRIDFAGGTYAVARCEVPEGDYEVIGRTWQQLVVWREESGVPAGSHQWLEETVPVTQPGIAMILDLYLPIAG